MNTPLAESNQIKIDPTIKTAIIYSIDGLYAYTVEIKYRDRSYFISHHEEPMIFGNMEDARAAALKENVHEAYLALSKTYAETDLSSADKPNFKEHFDYSPIALSTNS